MASRIDRLLIVLLLGSVGFNVYQAWQPRLRADQAGGYNSLKMAGRSAPEFTATDRSGKSLVIRTNEKPLLLYVLRPGCKYCELNTQNMQAMWKQLSNRYKFVGLNIGDESRLDDYLKANPLPFEVLSIETAQAQSEELQSYSFSATPALYLIEGAKIQRAWAGAFSHFSQADIEKVFGIRIPGAPV